MLIQKTLKTIPWLNKGLFLSLRMLLFPLWVFLQTEMTDFLTPSYTSQRRQSVVKRGGGGGEGFMFHSAIRIPLLKFMPLALIIGTSNGHSVWCFHSRFVTIFVWAGRGEGAGCRPTCPYSAACASTS